MKPTASPLIGEIQNKKYFSENKMLILDLICITRFSRADDFRLLCLTVGR